MLPNFTYVKPASLPEAIRQASAQGARIHSGGTDLLGCLRDQIFDAGKLVSLGRIAALTGIGPVPTGGTRVGAMTTLSEVASSPLIVKSYPVLAQAAALRRQPAAPQSGDHRRQHLPAAPLLVLPRRFPLRPQGW